MLLGISAIAQLWKAPLACHLCHMMQCKWCPLELCNSVILTSMWDSKAFKSTRLCWAIILKPLAEQLMGKMLSRWRPGSQPGHLSLQIMPLCIWVTQLLLPWDSEASDIETLKLPNLNLSKLTIYYSPTSPTLWHGTCYVPLWLQILLLEFLSVAIPLEQNPIWSLTLSFPFFWKAFPVHPSSVIPLLCSPKSFRSLSFHLALYMRSCQTMT